MKAFLASLQASENVFEDHNLLVSVITTKVKTLRGQQPFRDSDQVHCLDIILMFAYQAESLSRLL